MPSNITNIKFRSTAPNFERDQIKYLSDLKNIGIGDYDEGHIVYCVEDKTHYVYRSTNTPDIKTGYFTKLIDSIHGEDGKNGVSIDDIKTRYAIWNDPNNPPSSSEATWYDYSPATTNDYKYLWRETIIYLLNITEEGKVSNKVFYEMIGTHGDKGIDGDSVEYIYKLTRTKTAPAAPTSNDPITTNNRGEWTDDSQNIDNIYRYEWISEHIKTWNEDTKTMEWGPYSTPSLWKDIAKNIQNIISEYAVYSKNTESEDVLKNLNWTSNSQAVTYETPYLWKRYKIEFDDGSRSDSWVYEVIGKLGDKGIDGKDVEFVFKMTTTKDKPTKPNSSNEITTNIPGEWTDDPLTMSVYGGVDYKYQWVSKRTRENDVWSDYSEPSLWSELYPGKYIHIKYSNDNGKNFTGNNGYNIGKYIGIYIDSTEADSDEEEDYSWRKFEGTDGYSREYIFKLGDSVAPEVPSISDNIDNYKPEGWGLDPDSPTPTLMYCWACHRDKVDGVWGGWTGKVNDAGHAYVFSMYSVGIPGPIGPQGPQGETGPQGIPGETGRPGAIVYPRGEWISGETYSQTIEEYEVDGHQYYTVLATPYVIYDDKYYILNTKSTTSTPGTDDHWLEMEKMDVLYAEILLANNALVGQAVFNGNYMFSQSGINQKGGTSNDYTKFKHSDPYNSNNEFRPAWCVNLVTGEQWAGAGSIYFGANSSDSSIRLTTENTTATINKDVIGFTSYEYERPVAFEVRKDFIKYQGVAASETGGTKEVIALNIFKDGSGSLAHGNISWDSNGNLTLHKDKFRFNSDGSGQLAGGAVSWDDDGNTIIDAFSPYQSKDDSSMDFNLKPIPKYHVKNFSIPYVHASRTVVEYKFACDDDSSASITYVKVNGEVVDGIGSILVEPSMTNDNRGSIGVINAYGLNLHDHTQWFLIEDASMSMIEQ